MTIHSLPQASRTTITVLLVALLSSLLVATTGADRADAADFTPTATAASQERDFLTELNRERSARGLRSLDLDNGVSNVAREWSGVMASKSDLYHRPNLSGPFVGSWRRLGENVGVGSSVSRLHTAFMNSSGHRANVVGDYTSVGIGVVNAGSRIWVTFNFVKGDDTVASKYRTTTTVSGGAGQSGPFSDISSTVHRNPIIALDQADVAISCSWGRYCPDRAITRAEMAVFLARALNLPDRAEPFRDVASSHPYAGEIGAIAARGITVGCNPPTNDRFCPDEPVTRQQMASFLVRARNLSPTSESFRDVYSDNVHRASIGAIAKAGITVGCNPPNNNRYCPTEDVTRGQMASFIQRAFRF